jgi:hypothetical protein
VQMLGGKDAETLCSGVVYGSEASGNNSTTTCYLKANVGLDSTNRSEARIEATYISVAAGLLVNPSIFYTST